MDHGHTGIIPHLRKELVREDGFAVIADFSGTYIGKQMEKEERMIYPIFRVFEAAKPERSRKVNVDPRHRFDPFEDSLLDYGSIIGSRLKKPWQQFNRLISVHVPSCPNRCWHCYLPKELFTNSEHERRRWEYVTGEDIVSRFLNQREADRQHGRASNVLRITGGEPFLLPELILACLKAIRQLGLEEDVFLWTETNLLPFIGKTGKAFMDGSAEKQILEELGSFNNLAVHPCFHGLDPYEFNEITRTGHSVTLDEQIEGIGRLLNANIHVYPTFGSNVCNPANIPALFKKLMALDSELPLKLALVRYDTDYEPIARRIETAPTSPRLYSHYSALRIWNELLLCHYGVGYGVLPRHIGSPDGTLSVEEQSSESASGNMSVGREVIFLFKNSFRQLYHREILEYLAYPYNHIVEITYERRHIQDDLFFHMSKCPRAYEGLTALWCYEDDPHQTRLPFRLAEICETRARGPLLTMKLRLKEFISFSGVTESDLPQSVTRSLMEFFGERALEPFGKYMLLGEYPFMDSVLAGTARETSFSKSFGKFSGQVRLSHNGAAFGQIVVHLLAAKKMEKSIFYRIETEGLKRVEKENDTLYQVNGGKSFKIDVHFLLPNYDNFDEEKPSERAIVVELSNSIITPSGPTQVVCSKYGRESLSFRTEKVTKEKEVRLTFRSLDDQFRGANSELRIIVLPDNLKGAFLSTIGALILLFVTICFTALTKAVFSAEPLGASKHPFSVVYNALGQVASHFVSSWSVAVEYVVIMGVATFLIWCVFLLDRAGYKSKV